MMNMTMMKRRILEWDDDVDDDGNNDPAVVQGLGIRKD